VKRPQVIDTFPFFGDPNTAELDILQMRLEEIYDAVDYLVAVEADVDHQGNPKPYHLTENLDRFSDYLDKLIVVRATDLPTVEDYPNPWSREQAQREYIHEALAQIQPDPDDIILHGDVDEIPRAVVARNVRATGYTTLLQRAHFWAVDWLHPNPDDVGIPWWCGTVAAPARGVSSFAEMRNSRRHNPTRIPNAGWHFSWLGGAEANLVKVHAFCHPEVADTVEASVADGHRMYTHGIHTNGIAMDPVDVDATWPAFIRERRCPENWFRPREAASGFTEEWFHLPSQHALADLARATEGVPGDIIEVGSWEGRSTCALARAVAPSIVHAVDTWEGSPGEISAELAAEPGRDVFATFRQNVRELTNGNVSAHQMGWREFFKDRTDPIRFLFIDAEHTYAEVYENIVAALPLLSPGAIICGDDVHHPPIREAVRDALGGFSTDAALWWVKR
jgi:hypothetical protein